MQISQGNQPLYQQPYNNNSQPNYGLYPNQQYTQQPPSKKKNHAWVVVLVVVLVAVLCTGGYFLYRKYCNSKDMQACKEVINEYFEAYENQDVHGMYSVFQPDIRAVYNNNENDFFSSQVAYFGGDFTVEYEITDVGEFKDGFLDNVIDDLEDQLNISISKVDASKALHVEEKYSGPNGYLKQTETIAMVKQDGEWYILTASVDEVTENTVVDSSFDTTEDTSTEEYVTEDVITEEDITEEIITTEDTTETAAPTSEVSGSYDFANMPFSVNGKEYNLVSLTYADIVDMGFYFEDSFLEQTLAPGEHSDLNKADLNSQDVTLWTDELFVKFENRTNNPQPIKDCNIIKIELSDNGYNKYYTAALPNGITFGMTYDAVKDLMGVTPSSDYALPDGSYQSLNYENSSGEKALELNFVDDKLVDIYLIIYSLG